MGTHRISEDVSQRLWTWAFETHKRQGNVSVVGQMTLNDCLDELLREVGF